MIDKEKYKTVGEFIGSSGTRLEEYYDFMKMFDGTNEKDLDYLTHNIYEYREEYPNIIGMETFGSIFVSWAWYNGGFHPLYLLKPRSHGNRERLYGKISKNFETTYLLDDVVTTGKTIKEAIEYLSGICIKVDRVIALKSRLKEICGIKIDEIGQHDTLHD